MLPHGSNGLKYPFHLLAFLCLNTDAIFKRLRFQKPWMWFFGMLSDRTSRTVFGVQNYFNPFLMQCNREEFLLLIRQPAM